MLLKFKTWFVLLWKKVTKKSTSDFQVYERGKIVGDPKIIVFKDENEVALFKLEQEKKILEAEIERIKRRLEPWEEEMRKRHRKLWNYNS